MAVRAADLSVLPERRPIAHHLVREPRRSVQDLRLRRVRAISQGVRRTPRLTSGHAGRRFGCDADAGCGGDAARIQVIGSLKPERKNARLCAARFCFLPWSVVRDPSTRFALRATNDVQRTMATGLPAC